MVEDTSAAWTVAWGTLALAAATLLLALVAIFQDRIRSWLTRPRLKVSVLNAPPDCHKTKLAAYSAGGAPAFDADCYYFRLRVKNEGDQRAEFVEVYAAELLEKQADNSYKKVDSFLPMNLVWAHVGRPFLPAISPGMEKLCDLGHVIKPSERHKFPGEDNPGLGAGTQTLLCFDLEVKPNTLTHLIGPGDYRLKVLVAAGNTKPVEQTLEINLTGSWYDNEAQMLGKGVGLKAV